MSQRLNLFINERLPVLIASIVIGFVFISGGLLIRADQKHEIDMAVAATGTAEVIFRETMIAEALATTPVPSATPFPTLIPTNTLIPSPTPTVTLTPTNTVVPSPTPNPTNTPVPTSQPYDPNQPIPTPIPTREYHNTGQFAGPSVDPITEIPPPAEPVPVPDGVVNILLLGSDSRRVGTGNTDVIMVVSVNINEGTVNMLSIPRDLLVYVPGWTMARINTAYAHGLGVKWPGGGFGLMQETLLYNFGIYVGHYAFVNLSGFQGIVDVVGGVDVPVDCALQGYVLKEPRMSQSDFVTYEEWETYTGDVNNWEITTLPVGVHHLDGYMALFYARFRKNLDDFDRAYRQQQVLRAIASKAKQDGILNLGRLPALWQQYNSLVDTSMALGNMLQFMPIAADLDGVEVRSFVMGRQFVYGWDDPATDSVEYYLRPDYAKVKTLVTQAMMPPAHNYLVSTTYSVEVRNGTPIERVDEVAADRLTWMGLAATPTGPADNAGYTRTVIYDFTGRGRSTQLQIMQSELRVGDSDIIYSPDPNRVYDYVVILGNNYSSCTRRQPQAALPELNATPTPEPQPTQSP